MSDPYIIREPADLRRRSFGYRCERVVDFTRQIIEAVRRTNEGIAVVTRDLRVLEHDIAF